MPASRPPRQIVLALALAFAAAAAAGGCRPASRTASVSGTVTLNNDPPNARLLLSFVGADNVPRSVETDEAGNFSLSSLPVGEVAVMVSPAGRGGPGRQRAGGRGVVPPGAEPPRAAGRNPSAAEPVVPAGYSDAAKPLLRYNLGGGSTTLRIEMTTARR